MSAHLRTALALAAAALGVALTGGCRDTGPLRIGIVISETAVSGARVAADSVNASGGIGGRPLELVVLPNSAADAEPAIRGAERFANDPTILAVVGHSNSAATLAASQVYNAHGLPHIAPTSTATLLTAAGPYSFRMVPSDRSQAAFLVAVARRLAGARTAAIVYENDDYGRGLNLDVTRELAERRIDVVASLPYMAETGVEAMEFIPRRLAERPPEVVLWLGRFTRLSAFLEEMHRLLPEVVVLATEGVDSPELYGNLDDFVGLHFLRFVDAGSSDPCMQTLRGHPGAQQGGRAQDVLTHDAVLLVAEVLRGGARTRAQVRDGLAAVGTTAPALGGCAGPIRFDSAGDMDRPYLVARIDSGGVTALRGLP